jgi:protein-L-isoaspartate O-methyltransferase
MMAFATIIFASWAVNPDKFLTWGQRRNVHFSVEFAVSFAVLFFGCMICHGEVSKLRPATRYLTTYYLLLSIGGALGGVFVSLIAPVIFEKYFEWGVSLELVVLASVMAILRAIVVYWPRLEMRPFLLAVVLVLTPLAGTAIYWIGKTGLTYNRQYLVAAGRNFYGSFRVMEYDKDNPEIHMRMFVHGNIRHGQQFLKPEKQKIAGSYYPPASGAAKAIEQYSSGPARVGVIGLGAGTLAAYGKLGDHYTFYEINPMVEKFARTYFTFLEQCDAKVDVLLGDARLSMERQEPQNYDVIIVDAFSGDAIPVHLITKEAMDVYARHLKPDGMLVFHISNSYLDLYPVTLKLAEYAKMDSRLIISDGNDAESVYRTDYVVLTNRNDFLRQYPKHPEWRTYNEKVPLWTDHYSNLFQILKLPDLADIGLSWFKSPKPSETK